MERAIPVTVTQEGDLPLPRPVAGAPDAPVTVSQPGGFV